MEEHTLSTLIDQYLLGTISHEDRMELEALMASDPSVAESVRDSKEAYKALVHARNRQLREKLKQLDKSDPDPSGLKSKWFGWLILLMVPVLLYTYLTYFHFDPASVARRNFDQNPGLESSFVSWPQRTGAWKKANDAFLSEQYQEAIELYALLAEEDSLRNAEARWNILLAQLALEGPSSNWRAGIELYARNTPEPFSSKAYKLGKLFESGLYKICCIRIRENLSAIKPRLI
jgi:hypothetical protein